MLWPAHNSDSPTGGRGEWSWSNKRSARTGSYNEEMAKWRYIHVRVEEVEKWRWRNGDEEMEMGARKKWKPVRRRNGKPHRQEMKIIVYPSRPLTLAHAAAHTTLLPACTGSSVLPPALHAMTR